MAVLEDARMANNLRGITIMHTINQHKVAVTALLFTCFLGSVSLVAADNSQVSKGYSELMEDKLPGAEATFQKMASSANSEEAIKGEEGLAEVELRRGKIIEASMRIEKVVKKAPKRTKARAIKAKVLYRQGKKSEAESELKLAENGVSDFRWQKAEAHTLKGNIYRNRKESSLALTAYKQALAEDPNDRDALTNMGVTLQELGQPEEAVKAFSQLKQNHPGDRLGDALLRQAQAAIAQKQDLEKQRYIDQLVKDLMERQQNQDAPENESGTAISAISILGFSDSNVDNLAVRAGYNTVLQDELTNQLLAANIKVVERAVLDKVMSELNLGSSSLAEPTTALKLGKIMAARLIATGSVSPSPSENRITMRLIDTETTAIVLALSERQPGNLDPVAVADKFTQSIKTYINSQRK
jgi:Tfp pilus assembly protein PilF